MRKRLFGLLTTLLMAAWLVTACGGGAPATEEAQEAVQEAQEAAQEAAEQVQEAAEEAQEILEKAAEQAQETVEEAPEIVEEAAEQVQETTGEVQETVEEVAEQAQEAAGEETVAEEAPAAESETSAVEVETDFPLLDDVSNIQVLDDANSSINYQTSATLEEIAEFYKQALSEQGLTERTITTVVSDQVVNLVFDGAANGKSVVVQAIPLGDVRNVNVRYE